MQYKKQAICDICGKAIDLPHARVEWNFIDERRMHICHHECSCGMRNKGGAIKDMILDQGLYDEELVFQRLSELEKEGYCEEARRVKEEIFVL